MMIMTEYKGIRIHLPQAIEDMMLCNEKSVTMFNACFWAFAEHVIDETRKNCRISEASDEQAREDDTSLDKSGTEANSV